MILYLVIFTGLIIGSLCIKKQKKAVGYFFIILLSLIVGIRCFVGTDWGTYVDIYDNYLNNFDFQNSSEPFFLMEPLFVIIGLIFNGLGLTYHFYFFFLCFLNLYILRRLSIKVGFESYLFVLLCYFSLFFFQFNTNIVRHGLMAVFVWYGFLCFFSGQKFKAVFAILLGSLFQYAGLFFLVILFLINIKISRLAIIFTVLLSFILYYLQILYKIVPLFHHVPIVGDKLYYYIFEYNSIPYGLTIGMITNITIALLTYSLFYKQYSSNTGYIRLYVNALLISFCLSLIFNQYSIFVERIVSVLNLSLIFILYHYRYLYFQQLKNKVIASLFIYLYLILTLIKILLTKGTEFEYQFIPYQICL